MKEPVETQPQQPLLPETREAFQLLLEIARRAARRRQQATGGTSDDCN